MKGSARILAFCLLAALSLPLLFACNRNATTSTSSQTTSATTTPTNTTTTTTTPTPTTTTTTTTPISQKFLGQEIKPYGNDAFVAYDLAYGDRVDTSTQVKKASSQLYDVYMPCLPESLPSDIPVMLYVHGGSWSDPKCDKGADGPWLCGGLAARGMLVFAMNYVLQTKTGTAENATIDDMLADIDAMIYYLSTLLPTLGIEADAIALGGSSAGGHLSSLYAYKCGKTAALKIGFEVDIVGPTDLLTYKPVVEHMMTIGSGGYAQADTILMQYGGIGLGLFAGMAGVPADEEHLDEMWEKLEEYSTDTYVSADSCPTILAYAKVERPNNVPAAALPPGFESDGMVSTECYYQMVELLTEHDVPFVHRLFEETQHGDMWKSPTVTWIREQILLYAELYL
ncbi:MAG: alpha/beta hydrolase [Clostridia bacterium]|nr:alpha/beta hydrolase [Clostridia bacterium]